MKFTKLTSQIKLSSALITATTILGSAILSVPLLIAINNTNKMLSNDTEYSLIANQNDSITTSLATTNAAPIESPSFDFNSQTKFYIQNDSDSMFAVVSNTDTDVLYAWGNNSHGQLGINNKNNQAHPTRVLGLPQYYRITGVASSLLATTVVINGNSIWNSGSNQAFEHGVPGGNSTQIFEKNHIWNNKPIKSIHAGFYHRIVITTDGRAFGWGRNQFGAIGDGTRLDRTSPWEITAYLWDGSPKWATGEFHASGNNTAMVVEGEVFVWGDNRLGQLGVTTADFYAPAPLKDPVYIRTPVLHFALGSNHSIASAHFGFLHVWGDNKYGQLGLNTSVQTSPVASPSRLSDSSSIGYVTKVAASGTASFIQIEKKVYSCGLNSWGILAQDKAPIINDRIFAPLKLANAEVLGFYPAYTSLVTHLNIGFYMSGSNQEGQYGSGKFAGENNWRTSILPFRLPVAAITSKANNMKYSPSEIITDLKNAGGNAQLIKIALNKYTEGVNYSIGPNASYKISPYLTNNKTQVNMTLNTNNEFNIDGARSEYSFDINIVITNFSIDDSIVTIKKVPANAHTGNIQQILNPTPESTPPTTWANEIVDMTNFPPGTTFRQIKNDKIIPGSGGNSGVYEGDIYPSLYYDNKQIFQNSSKPFRFRITGLTKVADSQFSAPIIAEDLNLDNIMTELPPGQFIGAKYLPMFANLSTFPADAKFIISGASFDVDNRIYSGVLYVDKYYKNGFLTSGYKDFSFSDFKTIKTSKLVFTGFADDSIHSANIKELLINPDKTVNNDILTQFVNTHLFPAHTNFTIENWPDLDVVANTYTGKLVADHTYQNWVNTASEKELPFVFSGITMMRNSSIDYLKMPSGYDINNIEDSLKDTSGKIKKEALKQFIKMYRFPPHAEFAMGTVNKDTTSGKYTFEIIPSQYYHEGVIIDNAILQTAYSVTFQFATSWNYGLVIGLSVGGAALLAIITYATCWRINVRKHDLYYRKF